MPGPEAIRLRLSFQGDSVVLKIQDDGRGFTPQRSKAGKGKWRGIGLTNMRERALSSGGTCDVLSTPRKGNHHQRAHSLQADRMTGGRSTRSGWRPCFALAVANRNRRFTKSPLPPKRPHNARAHYHSSALIFSSSARNRAMIFRTWKWSWRAISWVVFPPAEQFQDIEFQIGELIQQARFRLGSAFQRTAFALLANTSSLT